jgi:Ca2+-binding RTX toxin-like protein
MAGCDMIDGGAGNDVLIGGVNVDRLNGGDGTDLLVGCGGVDRLYGGGDHSPDTLWGGAAVDRFYCRAFLKPGEIVSDAVDVELPWSLVV